jgi:Tol biopolymer transport system component/C-terminal processing protease CtpA/Prc
MRKLSALVVPLGIPIGLSAMAIAVLSAAQQPGVTPAASYAEPGISPDGREIVCVSGGDIWTVPAEGGEARLLVSDDGFKSRPLYAPDGQSIAFVSTRTGGGDIDVLSFATGAVRRLTMDDGLEQLDNWSRDGKWIYFSTTSRDIAGMNDIYRVSSDGGTPMPVSEDRYVNEFQAAPSPDGTRLAFAARGVASSQWWRKAGSHLDESEIDVLDLAAPGPDSYRRVVQVNARNEWPMWDATGRSLFYVSSDDMGVENIASIAADSNILRAGSSYVNLITTFHDGRVLWPSITLDGKTIAFERNFGIWTLDTATKTAREIPITRRGAPTTAVPDHRRQASQFEDLALSPDGKKIAFVAHGDVFAASAKDGGDAMRVTNTAGIESQPAWSPDSRRLAYVGDRDDARRLYLYDFSTGRETPLTSGPGPDISPAFSPDGKHLAFLRAGKDLRVVDLDTRQERSLATATFADSLDRARPVWSPDGQWIAVFVIGSKTFTNVNLVPASGGVPRPVSALANVNANTIAWSRDGSFVLFDTSQRTEPGQLARVDLTLRTPKYREDQFRDLFAPPPAAPATQAPPSPAVSAGPIPPAAAAPAPLPVVPVFDEIRRRLTLVPIGLDVQEVTISPDGKTALVTAAAAGQTNLYTYSLDELSAERPVARQLTSTAGGKADAQFTPDGKDVFYLEAGRINVVSLDKREPRPLAVTAELTADFNVDKLELFRQAWTLMRDNFFDAAWNGVDWNAERATFAPRIAGAASADEMRRLLRLMIGDLNASHLGVTAPGGAAPVVGRLGLRFDRREYETNGRLRVTDVLPLSPAAIARDIKPGDVLLAVDGRAIGPRVSLDDLLANTIDHRVVLSVAGAPGGPARDVVVKPTNQATEKNLLYREWVESNREYVLKHSGGRLGYVHMINMSAAALDQLHVDLDADNHKRDGVIIDIRNNSGGFVNAYAIDIFTRQPYLRMGLRGLPEAPARTVLGQRALELPTILVTNQHSLSDAEDFTEGYRTLTLGQVVGELTAGWIIYTWDVRLFDGTTFRLPRMRVKAADGTDMERHPRPVDIAVTRPIGESLTGKDSQLDEAIRALLKKLGYAE